MKYFTIQELTKSATAQRKGIKNLPDTTITQNLTALIDNVLDPLREAYGAPIIVTSGYRCEKLNKVVGGAASSQHVKGQAADIRSVRDSRDQNKRLFDLIRELKLPFDQLINEYDYIYQDPERYRNMTDDERDIVSCIGCISALGEIVVIMALICAAALFS